MAFFNPQVKVSVVLLVPLDFRRHPELEETNCNILASQSSFLYNRTSLTHATALYFFSSTTTEESSNSVN